MLFLFLTFWINSPLLELDGKWCNENGSQMILKSSGSDGNDIDGTYITAVGQASGTYLIRGRRTINPDGSQVLAFSVAWSNKQRGNSHSATAWSGQLQMIKNVPTITTMWLLTRASSVEENWQSTRVHKATFTKCTHKEE